MDPSHLSFAIFVLALAATFGAAIFGRRHSRRLGATQLADHRLNRWLVGLSAGATANSGFVVTGAVGLGYTVGAQWMMLPVAWLVGDILFWWLFPHRINRLGREMRAYTLTDVLTAELSPAAASTTKLIVGLLVVLCLGGYVAAQWTAGEKFLHGAFGLDGFVALVVFAALIVAYTAIGGFRGSVYADSLQALVRIVGTAVALGAVALVARADPQAFWTNWRMAGPDFLSTFPQASLWGAVAFVLGFAAAALGFELGQPQMITRYLAGATPEETRSAWWIYLLFVQVTWLAMTFFGMMLRGVMPGLPDPEAGLSIFFQRTTGPLLTGLIVADVFATIAATSNSLLIAMAQTFRGDLLQRTGEGPARDTALWPYSALLGLVTMAGSLLLHSSVFDLALSSVALLGAGLAPAMAARLFGWRPSGPALLGAVLVGAATAAVWKLAGLGGVLNEALPGMAAGAAVIGTAQFTASRRAAVAAGG